MRMTSKLLAAAMCLGAMPVAAQSTLDAPAVNLADWSYDDLYRGAMSAEEFIDEMEVYGAGGEEIGDVEDIIVGADGKVLAVIAEVGGLWDIGDTHISVPWDQIEIAGETVTIPVTEETVDRYDLFDKEYMAASEVESEMVGDVDNADVGPRAWRVRELIGDYARVRGDDDAFVNYGYVNDLLLKDGEVAAVVVTGGAGYGYGGYRAYPYEGRGWTPGTNFYNMPYRADEAVELEAFDYERVEELG